MAVEYNSDEGWFGNTMRITGEPDNTKLSFSRNHPATGQHPRNYYLAISKDGYKDIVVSEEDMLALFQHFLKCHDEYESGERNE